MTASSSSFVSHSRAPVPPIASYNPMPLPSPRPRRRCGARAFQLGNVWLEKIRWSLQPIVDIEKLRQGKDLLGELLVDLQEAAESSQRLSELAAGLDELQQKAPVGLREAGVDFEDPQQLQRWLRQAEGMLVSLLQEGDAS